MNTFWFISKIMLFGVFGSVILSGCEEDGLSSRDAAIERVIKITLMDIQNLKFGYPIDLVGTGGGIDYDTNKEKLISLRFQIYHPLSKDSARWLITTFAKLFLNNINQDKAVREFLPDGGFTVKNIDLAIFFSTPKNDHLYHPQIGTVSLYNGKISFATNDPMDIQNGPGPYKEIVYETYEEALKIADSQGRPKELTKR